MGSPTTSQTTVGIVADQEKEKIQQPLTARTFCIPGALTAVRHIPDSLAQRPDGQPRENPTERPSGDASQVSTTGPSCILGYLWQVRPPCLHLDKTHLLAGIRCGGASGSGRDTAYIETDRSRSHASRNRANHDGSLAWRYQSTLDNTPWRLSSRAFLLRIG